MKNCDHCYEMTRELFLPLVEGPLKHEDVQWYCVMFGDPGCNC